MKITAHQLRILELLLQGMSDKEIASELKTSRHAVSEQFWRMYRGLGITSGIKRVKLATMAYQQLRYLLND